MHARGLNTNLSYIQKREKELQKFAHESKIDTVVRCVHVAVWERQERVSNNVWKRGSVATAVERYANAPSS